MDDSSQGGCKPQTGSQVGNGHGGLPKLMLIGHTYMIAVNREKALHLAKYFQVRVCTCDSEGWKELGRQVTDENPPDHEATYQLRRLIRWPRGQNYTRLLFRGLQAEIADFQPDVILLENEPWSWLRWQARWAAWRAAPRALFAEFTWENLERPGFQGWLLRLLYRAAAMTGNKVICGNQSARKLCLAAGFPEEFAIVAAQLGISVDKHPTATDAERATWRHGLGWPASAKVVGFCGRLVEQKGLIELAEAVRSQRKANPDLRLALVGEGLLRPRLEAMDANDEWLKILPAVPHVEVPAFLNKLDIFILPSKPLKSANGQVWEEQFGHVLIEAMACGVLTLGSDSGGIPEVLDDPTVTFRHSDASGLASVLGFWLSHEEERKSKVTQQLEQCAIRWNHEAVARTYAGFLNEPAVMNQSLRHS